MSIRPLEPADLSAVAELRAHPEIAPFLGTLRPQASRANLLGVFVGQRLVAYVQIEEATEPRTRHRARLHLVCLRRDADAAKRLCRYAIETASRWLQLSKLDAMVDPDAPWRPVLEGAGFELEVRRRARRRRGDARVDDLLLGWLRKGSPMATEVAAPLIQPRADATGPIRVRPINVADAASIAAIQREESVMRGTLQTPMRSVALWREMLADGPAVNLGAELGGRIVGTVVLSGSRPSPQTFELGMAVSTVAQGRGVGSVLLQAALAIAHEGLGAHRVELGVYVDNPVAIALYEKAGFVREGVHRAVAWRGDGFADALHMAKFFSPMDQRRPLP